MGCNFEGTVYVPLDQFMELVAAYNPGLKGGGEWIIHGPRVENDALAVDVAYSDYCHPNDWAVKPKFMEYK
jgi:hypothetical protein